MVPDPERSDDGSRDAARSALLVHGGDLDAARSAFGDPGPAGWLDLSTGLNPTPYPIPDRCLRADSAHWCRLPGRAETAAFLDAFAATERLSATGSAACLAVPGIQAALHGLADLGMRTGRTTVAVAAPSYSGHRNAWEGAGGTVHAMPAAELLSLAGQVDVLVVVNPNNPDGLAHARSDLGTALERQARRGGWLVVDEAFVAPDPADGESMLPHAGSAGLWVLRSFGKFFGLAGLRLGVAAGPTGTAVGGIPGSEIDALANRMGVWSVSGPALSIGTVAMRDRAWISQTKDLLARRRASLDALLAQAGFHILGGTDLFRWTTHPQAETVYEQLGGQGILLRHFADPAQAHNLRVGALADEGYARLKAALHSMLS